MPDIKVGSQSWSELAKQYGVTVEQLKRANPGISLIQPGTVIRVPNTQQFSQQQVQQMNRQAGINYYSNYNGLAEMAREPMQQAASKWANTNFVTPMQTGAGNIVSGIQNMFAYKPVPTGTNYYMNTVNLPYEQAVRAATDSQRYAALYGNQNVSTVRPVNYTTYQRTPQAPRPGTAYNTAQQQAMMNARTNTGQTRLMADEMLLTPTMKTDLRQAWDATQAAMQVGATIQPQKKPLNYYITEQQIAKQAARRKQNRINSQGVDTTQYYGTTQPFTWKF